MKKHEVFTVIFGTLVLVAVLWAIYPTFQDYTLEPTRINPDYLPTLTVGAYFIAFLMVLLAFGLLYKYDNKTMEKKE